MAVYAKASAEQKIERNVIMAWATCPLDRADDLARALVEERLAACVNITAPVVSVYRWQGEVARDEERLLIIKTTRARREAMAARLLELHPYDVPELLFVPVDGSVPYLDWVCESVSEDRHSEDRHSEDRHSEDGRSEDGRSEGRVASD